MSDYLTVRDVATITGLTGETVRYWCRKHRIRRHGNAYLISLTEAERIRRSIQGHPGHPRKVKIGR